MKKYLVILLILATSCVDTRPPLEGTQSIAVTLVSPADPGAVDRRLADTQRTIVVNLTAKDAQNNLDTSFTGDVRVYSQFLGTLTPELAEMPLATIRVTNGVAMNQTIMLPSVLGPTTLWFDNGTGLGPAYEHGAVTGTSPTLWYRDPLIVDLQTPRDETAVDAFSVTPLTDKQISVRQSRYGARGVMVVTSTYAQGYTVSDIQCATGLPNPTPPCTTQAYDHILVFTFSSPRDKGGGPMQVGRVIAGFAGGLSEFGGLTEIGFPQTFFPEEDIVNPALIPPPVKINPMPGVDTTWFNPQPDPMGVINFERYEAGLVEIVNAKICPIDNTTPTSPYVRFKQWQIDLSVAGDKCGQQSTTISLVTAGSDFTTDPTTLVGRTLTRVVGTVRPVNRSFNVWVVYPRGAADVTLQ